MLIVPHLYDAPGKNFSPGQVSLRKSSLVNSSTLGYFCLAAHVEVNTSFPELQDDGSFASVQNNDKKSYLWQHMLYTSIDIMTEQRATFDRFEKYQAEIQGAFEAGSCFPWLELVSLQVPKFYSDLLEAVIGSVFVDSGGDLDVARGVLRKLGWVGVLERIAQDDVSVQHPVSRLGQWAAKNKRKLEYVMEVDEDAGMMYCTVKLDGEVKAKVGTVHRGKASQSEVKLAAADSAFRQMSSDGGMD